MGGVYSVSSLLLHTDLPRNAGAFDFGWNSTWMISSTISVTDDAINSDDHDHMNHNLDADDGDHHHHLDDRPPTSLTMRPL